MYCVGPSSSLCIPLDSVDKQPVVAERLPPIKRLIFPVSLVALVFGSLITFPAYTHWMAFLWVGLSLVAFVRHQPMWPWLGCCILIVAGKRPGYTAEFWVLAALFILVAFIDWRWSRGKDESLNKKRLALFALVLITATTAYGIMRWNAANTSRRPIFDDRPVACLGDSLTDSGYPQELARLISVPVADFGVDGIKTDDGIKMLPRILATNPQVVVIELGGHDYNGDNKPRSATKANLAELVKAFQARDIAVVLVEIPRGFIWDPYDGLERELAAEYDLQLIDDSVIRNFVFNSPIIPPGMWLSPSHRYSDDGLHPNALGNKYFARVVSRSLATVFGDSIVK